MKDVFDAYPKQDAIYVVDGMPFLTELEARNHAGGDMGKVQKVNRDVDTPPTPKGEKVGGDPDTPPTPKGEKVGGDADTPPTPEGEKVGTNKKGKN